MFDMDKDEEAIEEVSKMTNKESEFSEMSITFKLKGPLVHLVKAIKISAAKSEEMTFASDEEIMEKIFKDSLVSLLKGRFENLIINHSSNE